MYVKDTGKYVDKHGLKGNIPTNRVIAGYIKNIKNDIRFLYSFNNYCDKDLTIIIKIKQQQLKVLKILYVPHKYYSFINWLKTDKYYEPSIDKLTSLEYIVNYCLNNNYLNTKTVVKGITSDYTQYSDYVISIFISLYKSYINKK